MGVRRLRGGGGLIILTKRTPNLAVLRLEVQHALKVVDRLRS
jgi:hypothetical protein